MWDMLYSIGSYGFAVGLVELVTNPSSVLCISSIYTPFYTSYIGDSIEDIPVNPIKHSINPSKRLNFKLSIFNIPRSSITERTGYHSPKRPPPSHNPVTKHMPITDTYTKADSHSRSPTRSAPLVSVTSHSGTHPPMHTDAQRRGGGPLPPLNALPSGTVVHCGAQSNIPISGVQGVVA